MLKGIDISKWQAGIDLSKIDTDFVICKATEGVGYTDKYCDKLYQQAKKLGKKLGVYHFARPDLRNTATAEADWFVRETKGYHKEAMLILDWESGNLKDVNWAKQWLDRVYEKTGVKPVIYMSASVMSSADWSSVANADYGLWVANYGSNNGTAQESVFDRYPLKYWSFYALWQYTSVGRLSGYSGNLDLNYFSGDKEAWDKYAGGSSSSSNNSNSNSDTNKADQLLFKGSKVKFNGIFKVDMIKSPVSSNLFGCCELTGCKLNDYKNEKVKDYHWLPTQPFVECDSNGNITKDQVLTGGKSYVKNDSIYTVQDIDIPTNSAKLNINGRNVWVFSTFLYEVSDK